MAKRKFILTKVHAERTIRIEPKHSGWAVLERGRPGAGGTRTIGVEYQSRTSYTQLLRECGFIYQKTGKVFKSRSETKVADLDVQLEKNDRCGANCTADGCPGW